LMASPWGEPLAVRFIDGVVHEVLVVEEMVDDVEEGDGVLVVVEDRKKYAPAPTTITTRRIVTAKAVPIALLCKCTSDCGRPGVFIEPSDSRAVHCC